MKSRNCNRYQCWDEENRLAAVRDVAELSQLSVYLYDGGGERAWKLSGQEMETQLSGKTVYTNVYFDKTLYSSPLMVVTDQEYSKHFFIEGERVCTKIGSGFGTAQFMPDSWQLDFITGDWSTCSAALMELVVRDVKCTGYDGEFVLKPNLPPAQNDGAEEEYLQYFYHSDHLGSASFVTDATGYVDQHIQYLPFGELFISQRNSTFDSRYKFTAKELDNETQYTYFGARHYDSDISIWLSIDPLSDKYPSLSPYAYCANNPVILVDPDGQFPIPAAFRDKFPHLTKYIENNLEGYFLNSPRILATLNKYSVGMLTPDQIKSDFNPQNGPTINFTNFDYGGTHAEYDGHTNTINFNETFLQVYEDILRDNKVSDVNKQMSLFDFVNTFINEYTHYGDALDGFDAVMDVNGNIVNDYDNPEPCWSMCKFDEGNHAVLELFGHRNGRDNYLFYKEGKLLDWHTRKLISIDINNIDASMIPPIP